MEYDVTNSRQNEKLIKFAGVGFILWHLGLKYLYAVQRLKMKLFAVQFPYTDLDGFQIDIVFAVLNPTAVPLTFTGFDGNVLLNGAHVTEFAVPRQTIKTNGTSGLTLSLFIRWSQIGTDIIPELLQSKLADSTVTIDGTFHIGGYNIPITVSKKIAELTQ